jgi:hypothetical protein
VAGGCEPDGRDRTMGTESFLVDLSYEVKPNSIAMDVLRHMPCNFDQPVNFEFTVTLQIFIVHDLEKLVIRSARFRSHLAGTTGKEYGGSPTPKFAKLDGYAPYRRCKISERCLALPRGRHLPV